MNNTFSKSLLALAVGGLLVVGSASAQTSTSGAGPGVVDPGHPRVNEVNQREENQQKRIANGINSGSMNAHETANVERREASVQKQEQADMAKHNGHLTRAEQRQLNRRQDRISRTIYKDKHSNKKSFDPKGDEGKAAAKLRLSCPCHVALRPDIIRSRSTNLSSL